MSKRRDRGGNSRDDRRFGDHRYWKVPIRRSGNDQATMTDTTEAQTSNPLSPQKSELSLDSAPLELTVTTSITSLTPSSSSSESTMSTSPASTPAAAPNSEECSVLDVGSVDQQAIETENDMDHGALMQRCQQRQSSRMASPIGAVLESDTEIRAGARFVSFADFERVFEVWKATNYHMFRVASSETLRLPDGSTNAMFKYRYIVFHCAHYGQPRKRGAGKRPNQNYMPCGCKAMLRLNYSWSENALRVTTLNEEHFGHDVSEDAYYKFAAKAKQRLSSSSPPAVNGGALPPPSHLLAMKRHRSESPYSNASTTHSPQQQPPAKKMKNGHSTQAEAPLNLSKAGLEMAQTQLLLKKAVDHAPVAPPPPQPQATTTPTPALSVLMFNHQQQQVHQQQQHAYHELIRLLSVNGNGGPGLVTALGASGVRDCRTESDRHRLIYPIMQTLTQQLAGARGFDFDEKLRDLKAILKKWQLLQQAQTPSMGAPSPNLVNRSSSAAAAAAAMMVQAMSAGAGNGFGMPNGHGTTKNGTNGIGGNGCIPNGH